MSIPSLRLSAFGGKEGTWGGIAITPMPLLDTLKQLDLGEKEAAVYLALLQAGSASVAALSKRAGTKRPTTYLILEELRQKSLASAAPGRKRMMYTAESPQRLLDEANKKQALIRNSIPELLAIFNSKKEKPKIRYYQGADALVSLYATIFKHAEIEIFGSIAAIAPEVLRRIWPHLQLFETEKKSVRDLVPPDQDSIAFAKKHSSVYHEIKIAPAGAQFPTDNILYDNSLAIFSYKDIPSVVVIESSDVAGTYRTMFNLVWDQIPSLLKKPSKLTK